MPDYTQARWPDRVAVAIVRGDVPQGYMATDATVLTRVLARRLVAPTRAKGPGATAERVQQLDLERTCLEIRMAKTFEEIETE